MGMSQHEVDSAVAYNKRQGYTRDEVKVVQTIVGATVDGAWGPKTVTSVYQWQASGGLVADGKVGPATYAAMKEQWECRPPPEAPSVEVGCGLAAYDQAFPGHTPEEAMQVAYDRAVAEGATEIRFWSSEWLIDETLPNGGNKGNLYSGPWLASQNPGADLIIGAWVDDPISNATKPGFAERLAEMHLRRAALMLNKSNTTSSTPPWALRWERDDLDRIAKLYDQYGIEVVGTCWPRPSKSQIDAMCEDMYWILDVLGTNTFEVDTEGNWTSKFLDGFKNMDEASEYLAGRMRDLVGADGTLELTTYTYHGENSGDAKLAPLMDRLLPQAYSVRHRTNKTIGWSDSLGPGRHQALAMGRARQAAAAA
jgi:hypothetical protein